MIIYRNEPYPIQMRNIILLDDIESGGVLYVNKDTYDQALLLSGRLDGDPARVLSILKTPKNEVYRTMIGLKGLMDTMMQTMPKPLNMLAPFLIFCYQNQGIEWDAKNRVMAYGILHQFSQLVDFNTITLVPAEVRSNLSLPTIMINQYQASWDDLCKSLEDKLVTISTGGEGSSVDSGELQSLRELITKMQEQVVNAVSEASAAKALADKAATASAMPMPMPMGSPMWNTQPLPGMNEDPAVSGYIEPVDYEQHQQPKVEAVVPETTDSKNETAEEKPAQADVNAAKIDAKADAGKNNDEAMADDVMAIINAMKAEAAERDKEREKKLGAITPKAEPQEAKEEKVQPIHTSARSTEAEAKELNAVLDEFDF